MWFFWSPVNIINIFFCAIIVAVSLLVYRKSKDKLALVLAVSFAIFGVSHICAMSRLVVHCTKFILIFRSFAYIAIIYVLLKKITNK